MKFGTRKLGTICSSAAINHSNRMLTSQPISFQKLAPDIKDRKKTSIGSQVINTVVEEAF